MKPLVIDCLSDTHSTHESIQLLGGDILIHAGDSTRKGEKEEVDAFLNWFQKQKYTHRILIAGNHDFLFERDPEYVKKACSERKIILLNDSGITLEGIKIWGSPITPVFEKWAFIRERGPDIKQHWDLIPKDTEILITHGPPYGVLDKPVRAPIHTGCEELAKSMKDLQVLLHVFGHIHEGRGACLEGNRLSVNASSLDENYEPCKKQFIRVLKQDGSYKVAAL